MKCRTKINKCFMITRKSRVSLIPVLLRISSQSRLPITRKTLTRCRLALGLRVILFKLCIIWLQSKNKHLPSVSQLAPKANMWTDNSKRQALPSQTLCILRKLIKRCSYLPEVGQTRLEFLKLKESKALFQMGLCERSILMVILSLKMVENTALMRDLRNSQKIEYNLAPVQGNRLRSLGWTSNLVKIDSQVEKFKKRNQNDNSIRILIKTGIRSFSKLVNHCLILLNRQIYCKMHTN